jgi:hypothetical protein
VAVSKRLRQTLRWGREERAELAEAFLEHKIVAYVETLSDLLADNGVTEWDEDDIADQLSDSILRALRAEAREHAGFVVDTFNGDLDAFLERNADLPRAELLDSYDAWSTGRADARSEITAITEAYSAAADATLAFWEANAPAGEYDFGGHPELGDDAPECKVCQALVASNPHPVERVREIGNPHIGCRQNWHRKAGELPDELRLPEEPAGIVGAQPLVNRHGNDHDAAAEWIAGLASR